MAWGRLRQLTTSGHTRDVLHLAGAEIVLGREEGHHHFPDDDFMSRRHAVLTTSGGRGQLADLGSSNGTYVRLRGEHLLRPGDCVRLGDQLLFVEVKARRRGDIAPETGVGTAKRRRLARLAYAYLAASALPPETPWRIDVIAVEIDGGGRVARLEQIEGAVEE